MIYFKSSESDKNLNLNHQSCLMIALKEALKLGVVNKMTQSTAIKIFTALVFPLSTFIYYFRNISELCFKSKLSLVTFAFGLQGNL